MPNFDAAVSGAGEDKALEAGSNGVNGIIVGPDGLQAFGVRDSPHLESLVPRARVEKALVLVQAQARNSVEMLYPEDAPFAADLDVVLWVHGALEEVLEGGQASNPLMNLGVLRRNLPHPNLAVLMAGEQFFTGDDNRLDQPAVGLKPRIGFQILPHAYVLAVGARVEQIAGGSQGVDVTLLPNHGPDEAKVVGQGGGRGRLGP